MDNSIKCCDVKCSELFYYYDTYRVHLNVIHLNNLNTFKCTIDKCESTFMRSNALITHLSRVHKFLKQPNNKENCISSIRYEMNHEISTSLNTYNSDSQSTVEFPQDADLNNANDDFAQEDFAQDTLQTKIQKILLDFLIDLHANSHMTKEDINGILNKIKKNIVDPIILLTNINKNDEKTINAAFKRFSSQYKFEQCLLENGYIVNGK